MHVYAGLCVNQATADPRHLNRTSEMTSKATTKIGWRAATGGPLAWALRRCDEREEASKDQDDEEQANLGTREVSYITTWLSWFFVNQGQSLQFRNGKPDLRSKISCWLTRTNGFNHDVFGGFFVFERPGMSRKIFFFPLKFPHAESNEETQGNLGDRKWIVSHWLVVSTGHDGLGLLKKVAWTNFHQAAM